MSNFKKVLVVAAHPDDEVLGCGATMAKHVQQKDTVWVLILGQGITSRFSNGKKVNGLLKELYAASQKANGVLGVSKLVQKDFPDNSFDSLPRLKIIHAIEEVIRQFKPEIVYTHSNADLNIDHQICCESVQSACRPMEGHSVKKVLTFEIASSSEWHFGSPVDFKPNFFNDVTDFLPKKLDAMRHYKGELRPFPHPRSIKNLESLARVRGSQSGLKAAEAFCLLRETVG